MARTHRAPHVTRCWNKEFAEACVRGHVDGRSPIDVNGCKDRYRGSSTRRFWKSYTARAGRRNAKIDISFQITYF